MGKLFVGNIAWSTNEEKLKAHFEEHGEVHSVKIVRDRDNNNRSKGYGFIEMENAEQAMEALNEKHLDGRPLRVGEARERERKPAESNAQ